MLTVTINGRAYGPREVRDVVLTDPGRNLAS